MHIYITFIQKEGEYVCLIRHQKREKSAVIDSLAVYYTMLLHPLENGS
jgi:hypothetical protein